MDGKKDIILDLDGTLIETRQRHWSVYKRVTRELGGSPLPLPVYWRLKRAKVSTETLLAKSNLPTKDKAQFVSRFISVIEKSSYLFSDTCFPFIPSVLQALTPIARLYLVTLRRNKKSLMDEVNRLSLSKYFVTVLAKPSGANPVQTKVGLIQSLNIAPYIVIGDTEADVEAAHTLNTRSIAVLSGIRNEKILSLSRPDYLLRDLRTLPKLLTSLL